MTITPLSLDFTLLVDSISQSSNNPQALSPYGFLQRGIIAVWLSLPVEHPNIALAWTANHFESSFSLYLLVFLLKLPLLIADIATGVAIYCYLGRTKTNRKALGFFAWIVNPVVLVFNEMWAPVDLLPTFFLFSAILMVSLGKRRITSLLSFALSIAMKLFPLLILPAIAIALKNRRKHLFELLLGSTIGVLFYFTWVIAVGFDALTKLQQYDPLTQYLSFEPFTGTIASLGQQVGMGFGQQLVSIGIVAVAVVVVLMLKMWSIGTHLALDGVLVTLLVLLAFIDWWPQYFLWLLPFLSVSAIVRRGGAKYAVVLCTAALFLALVTFNVYFTDESHAFLFFPVYSETIQAAVVQFSAFTNNIVVEKFAYAVRLIFSASSLAYAYEIFKGNLSNSVVRSTASISSST
jgi:hypothetical protein